jgi:hypothetical protein
LSSNAEYWVQRAKYEEDHGNYIESINAYYRGGEMNAKPTQSILSALQKFVTSFLENNASTQNRQLLSQIKSQDVSNPHDFLIFSDQIHLQDHLRFDKASNQGQRHLAEHLYFSTGDQRRGNLDYPSTNPLRSFN